MKKKGNTDDYLSEDKEMELINKMKRRQEENEALKKILENINQTLMKDHKNKKIRT